MWKVLFALIATTSWAQAAPVSLWVENGQGLEPIAIEIESAAPEVACVPPENPSKVLLFVDLNASEKEVASAQRAACIRGEGFVHVPGLHHLAILSPWMKRVFFDREEHGRIIHQSDRTPQDRARLVLLGNRISEYEHKLKDYVEANQLDTLPATESAVKAISEQNQKISALVISGHHGDSFFGILDGGLDGSDMWEIFQKFPAVVSELSLLALWGCDSVTPTESKHWKMNIPSLKVIAGFYDTAPAGPRVASYGYLESVLLKEKELQKLNNVSILREGIGMIDHLFETFSSLYIQSEENKELFFNIEEIKSSTQGNVQVQARYRDFEESLGCDYFNSIVADQMKLVTEYALGLKNTPLDKRTSDLRHVYDTARQNRGCLEKSKYASQSADYIGLLLWFDGVKVNFARTFKDLIGKAQGEMTQISEDTYRSIYEPILESARRNIETEKQDLQQITAENALLIAEKKTEAAKAFSGLEEMIRDMRRRHREESFKDRFIQSCQWLSERNAVEDVWGSNTEWFFTRKRIDCRQQWDTLKNSLKPRLQKKFEPLFEQVTAVLLASERLQIAQEDNANGRRKLRENSLRDTERRLADLEKSVVQLMQVVRNRGIFYPMDEESIGKLKRLEILINIDFLERVYTSMVSLSQLHVDAKVPMESVENIRLLKLKMQSYLRDLNTTCAPFSEWHEARPANIAQAGC